MNSSKKFSLKATERVKSRKIIQQLFKEGKSFAHFPLRVVYINLDSQIAPLQAGFSVSTKYFKRAVDRNRIKRLMRESYRLQKNELAEIIEKKGKHLSLFFIFTGKELPVYPLIFEKIGNVLKTLEATISGE
ncbi:MAG: ribonuclease P protein component [Ginsengibacter sp.]|jgi:ribonuclease P protein component